MNTSFKLFFRNIGYTTLAWIFAATLFSFIRLYGVEEAHLYDLQIDQIDLAEIILLQGILIGGIFGLSFGTLDYFMDRKIQRTLSYSWLILIRSVAHLIFTLIILLVTIFANQWVLGGNFDEATGNRTMEILTSKTALVVLVYTGIVSMIFSLIRQINGMFGPGILVNIIFGKYHRPQETERIFMFLDLKSSTTYAERLGHKLYSELIQDCFYDLTDTLQKHKATVYQYVGDEAVLTWEVENGLEAANCIRAYFSYDASIQERARYYFDKYDLVPAFKAGLNIGRVMVAEVGVLKREIAYHSDVLNTAARIQGRCNDFGQRLLISEYLYERIPKVEDLAFEHVGEVSLKGRSKKVNIYAVSPTEEIEHEFAFSE
ncbi:adenylate/guanylate cyclase domain-containing protein [Pontibacter sp. G13]|uniref:adenylate/guanylate cyclase domain-containing protein n=1 Tax=Pontibacter sp. G13 TaxID=3074898 RepID=UPI00288AED17|nr:adenylate/guanylate cyclase domain-containing protein [Pontibacter sp. G13]WNJ20770.1 adenylate/guanylate cyclase domain-containing protein [Pontibacter sp. G13]